MKKRFSVLLVTIIASVSWGGFSLASPFNESEMIVYRSNQSKASIFVFTDIDCGYCRKLHKEIPSLIASGVEVNYLPFPRAGIGSKSYKKFVSVYCSVDKQKALDLAKNGVNIPDRKCENPVKKVYLAAKKTGIRGTPAIFTKNGKKLGGYRSARALTKDLGVPFVAASTEKLKVYSP